LLAVAGGIRVVLCFLGGVRCRGPVVEAMITFVTGVSCSGKTTTFYELMKLLPYEPFDQMCPPNLTHIDDDGHPSAAHVHWLKWRGEERLLGALELAEEGMPSVIFGISWPHSIVESTVWEDYPQWVKHIGFINLAISAELLEKRLRERLAGKPEDEVAEYVRYNKRLGLTLAQQVEFQNYGVNILVDPYRPEHLASMIHWRWGELNF
jgi:hypothetical protein